MTTKLSIVGLSDQGALAQLVYRSTSVTGVTSALEMSDILAEARPRNAQLGITGILTAVDGMFVQLIEGPVASIESLLIRLGQDRRHTDIEVVDRRLIDDRAFGDWDMVSPRFAPAELTALANLLSTGAPALDDLIEVLSRALKRQEAVLEGRDRHLVQTRLTETSFLVGRVEPDV